MDNPARRRGRNNNAIYYTSGEPIPHTGVESDLHRHPNTMKIKNKFGFGPSQDTLLLPYVWDSCIAVYVGIGI